MITTYNHNLLTKPPVDKRKSVSQNFTSQKQVNSNYQTSFGNNPGKLVQVAEKLAAKVPVGALKSGFTHKVLGLAGSNPAFFEQAFATSIMLTLRPLTVLSVPGAKKEDKQYAAVKGMCSGIAHLAFAAAVFIPLAAGFKKFVASGKMPFPVGSPGHKMFDQIVKYGSKFVFAPIEAMVLFALLPPVIKKIFPKKAKEKGFDPPPTFAKSLNQDQQRLLDQFMAKSGKEAK